jgi:signal peptidase II
LLLALAVFWADQLSKAWVLSQLPLGAVRPFLPGLLALQRVSNSGAAFSLFSGAPLALGLVSLLVSVAVLVWILWRPPQGAWLNLALGFLLGGAVGNGLDRWRHGAVTDFLAFLPIQFPIFNLADVAINLAVLCFALDQLLPLLPRSASEPPRGEPPRGEPPNREPPWVGPHDSGPRRHG